MNLSDIYLEGIDWVRNIQREWNKVETSESSSAYFDLMGTEGIHPSLYTTGEWIPENGLECVASAEIYNTIKSACDELKTRISTEAVKTAKTDRQLKYVEIGKSFPSADPTKIYLYEHY